MQTLSLHLTGVPQHLLPGIAEAAAVLPLSFAEDGIPVSVEKGEKLIAELTQTGGRIVYSREVEIFRALSHIAREGVGCRITEKATFRTNGFMLDASRNAVESPEAVMRLIRYMALLGMDLLMLYTEDTYEVEGYPYFGYMRGGYTKADIRRMDDYAYSFGVEMMPCIQTLGHHGMILRWFRNMAPISDTSDVLLVGEEATYTYLRQIIRDACEPYRSKRIHIGMDESGSLGTGAYRRKHGARPQIDIFTEHMAKVREITGELGLTPMIWSDMYFALCSPTHDYDPDCVISDEVKAKIPNDVQLVYWDYYHQSYDFYRGVIDRHRETGAPLLFAGGMWNWQSPAVNYEYMVSTSVPGLRASRDAGVEEVFVTAWGDDGVENSLPSLYYGLALYAEFDYCGEYDPDTLNKRFAALFAVDPAVYCDQSRFDMVPDAIKDATLAPNPSFMLLYEDPLTLVFEKDLEGVPLAAHYTDVAEEFAALAAKTTGELKPMAEHYARLAAVLRDKCTWREKAPGIVRSGDRAAAVEMAALADKLIGELRAFADSWYDLWMTNNHPQGFDVLDIRMGAQIRRMETAARRMHAFAAGALDTIAEMEKEKLPYTIEREWWYLPYHGGTGKVGRFGPWAGCITAEFLGY